MLKIGEFSKITGVPIRTLRYYDEIDLFKPAEINIFTDYRYYKEEQIEDLKIINKLKYVGFIPYKVKENAWVKNGIPITSYTSILSKERFNELYKINSK